MKILVDADSCPKQARELILRRAARLSSGAVGIKVVFAANREIPGLSNSPDVVMELCPPGDNSADDRIVELAQSGDLVVTRDVPLAKRLVEKGAAVIDDRGRIFTKENINQLLSLRNFMVDLADNGLEIERTANYGKKELKTFADSLDRILTRCLKGTESN